MTKKRSLHISGTLLIVISITLVIAVSAMNWTKRCIVIVKMILLFAIKQYYMTLFLPKSKMNCWIETFLLLLWCKTHCCLGQSRLEEQQHSTDCAGHRCWISHGWGWKTCWHTRTQWWTVSHGKQPLHKEQWHGMYGVI